MHGTHTYLCKVSFVYEINKGWERVPIKLVVHFDYLILLVYSTLHEDTVLVRTKLARCRTVTIKGGNF